jgi:conflict system pore-forming effector with SLATT domain
MTTHPEPALGYPDLPAAFTAADQASNDYQSKAVAATRYNLILLVIAAAAGPVDVEIHHPTLNLGGVVSVVAFGCALVITLLAAAKQVNENWYRARAVAESIKTLAWRYAVGGDPFLVDNAEADATFSERLQAVTQRLQGLDWRSPSSPAQITAKMRALRAAPLAERSRAYLADRIDEQYQWYTDKGEKSRQRKGQWELAAAAAAVAGVIVGVLRALTVIDLDLVGVMAALGAATSAWSQMRQHHTLASSYKIAALELSLIKERADKVADELEWSRFVSDAEEAISREHTMWLARHGYAGGGE